MRELDFMVTCLRKDPPVIHVASCIADRFEVVDHRFSRHSVLENVTIPLKVVGTCFLADSRNGGIDFYSSPHVLPDKKNLPSLPTIHLQPL